MSVVDINLKEKVIYEALLFIRSVEFLDKEIRKTLQEIERAELLYSEEEINKGRLKLKRLLIKLNREDEKMGEFLRGEGKILYNIYEEKESLSNIGKKEQIYLRGVPTNPRGKKGGRSLQKKVINNKR